MLSRCVLGTFDADPYAVEMSRGPDESYADATKGAPGEAK